MSVVGDLAAAVVIDKSERKHHDKENLSQQS